MSTTVASAAPDAPAEEREAGRLARRAGDVAALVLLAAVLVWLEGHDGGRGLAALRWVGLVALLALPVLVAELRRLPRWAAWLTVLWVVGNVAAVAFGEIRAFVLRPSLVHAIVPVVLLATRRVWSRPWGPTAIGGLLAVSLGAYWHRSFLQWWGFTLNEQQPVWMALSWRNQSGALMAAFALAFLGVALRTTRVLRVAAILLAAASAAGVWLSSSRGAVLVAVLAAGLVVAAVLWRDADRRLATLATVAAVGLLTVGIGGALLQMDQRTAATSPLGSRVDSVERNGRARLFHMEAAAGMFVDRPVTGQGLGSYRELARPFTDPRANLTASAHNEYAENLGEGGLLLGGPFLVAHGAAGMLALGALRRRRGDDPLRSGLELGAAGVILVVGAHAALDFDWDYLVLPALLAVSAAVLVPRAAMTDDDVGGRASTWSAAAALALLLAVSVVATSADLGRDSARGTADAVEAPDPWPLDLGSHITVASQLAVDGDHAGALRLAERGLAWHPGSTRLATIVAVARFQLGELSAGELAAAVRAPWSRFDEYAHVASALIDGGELDLAAEVLDRQRAELEEHAAWGVADTARDTWPVIVRLEDARGGCAAAVAAAERALDDPLAALPGTVGAEDVLTAAGVDC